MVQGGNANLMLQRKQSIRARKGLTKSLLPQEGPLSPVISSKEICRAVCSALLSWPLESYMQKKLKSCLLRFKLMLPSPAHSRFTEQVIPFSPQHLP